VRGFPDALRPPAALPATPPPARNRPCPPFLTRLLALLSPTLALPRLAPGDPRFARAGERLAARHLRRLGWRLLGTRVRTAWAEIDLLLEDHGTLVAVEVKTGRSGPRFQPGMRLGPVTVARLERAVRTLARGAPARVDLVEVRLETGGRIALVRRADLRAREE